MSESQEIKRLREYVALLERHALRLLREKRQLLQGHPVGDELEELLKEHEPWLKEHEQWLKEHSVPVSSV